MPLISLSFLDVYGKLPRNIDSDPNPFSGSSGSVQTGSDRSGWSTERRCSTPPGVRFVKLFHSSLAGRQNKLARFMLPCLPWPI
jgi:hypothetical protein